MKINKHINSANRCLLDWALIKVTPVFICFIAPCWGLGSLQTDRALAPRSLQCKTSTVQWKAWRREAALISNPTAIKEPPLTTRVWVHPSCKIGAQVKRRWREKQNNRLTRERLSYTQKKTTTETGHHPLITGPCGIITVLPPLAMYPSFLIPSGRSWISCHCTFSYIAKVATGDKQQQNFTSDPTQTNYVLWILLWIWESHIPLCSQ